MMRRIRRSLVRFALLSIVAVTAGLALSGGLATAQTPTPGPIGMTGTALVDGATRTAAFGPTRTPSNGTATPLAGLCNSMTYRELDAAAAAVTEALQAADVPFDSVQVQAREETEDCLKFTVQQTDIHIETRTDNFQALRINDEAALGGHARAVLGALGTVPILDDLADVRVSLRYARGNQLRRLRFPYAVVETWHVAVDGDAALFNALTLRALPTP